jgi:hypothetical protein
MARQRPGGTPARTSNRHAPEGEADPALRRGASRAGRWCSPRERRLEAGQRTRFGAGAAAGRVVEVDSRRTPEGEASHALRRGARRTGRWAWPEGATARNGAETDQQWSGPVAGRAGGAGRLAHTGRSGGPGASARGEPGPRVGVALRCGGSPRGSERASAREQPRGGPARSKDWHTPEGQADPALRRGASRARGWVSLEGAAVRDAVTNVLRRGSGHGAGRRGRDWHAPDGQADRALRREASQAGRWVSPSGAAVHREAAGVLRHGGGHGADRRGRETGMHRTARQAARFGAGRAGPDGGCRRRERRFETWVGSCFGAGAATRRTGGVEPVCAHRTAGQAARFGAGQARPEGGCSPRVRRQATRL